MPINITDHTDVKEGERGKRLAWLCDNDWELPSQVEALERWLFEAGVNLPHGSYIADVGFSPREGALGGGGALTHKAMGIMANIGMDLFLSEYPAHEEE